MFNKLMTLNGRNVLASEGDIELINRVIDIDREIDSEYASKICQILRILDREDHSDITIYINSPGGSVSAGLYIYDTLKSLKSDIVTVSAGMAASMGAFLLVCGGTKGKRYALKNSEILIHQPLGGISGRESDIRIHADHLMKVRNRLNEILSSATGKSIEEINHDTESDYIMSPVEALNYGLIDHIGSPM